MTTDTDIKIKSEKPDILQLCHLLANQVLNLGTGVVWPTMYMYVACLNYLDHHPLFITKSNGV